MEVKPSKGEVIVSGLSSRGVRRRKIAMVRRKLGIVVQDFTLLEDRNVYDNLAFILKVTGTKRSLMKEKVRTALKEVGLENSASRSQRSWERRRRLSVGLSGQVGVAEGGSKYHENLKLNFRLSWIE